MSRPNTLASSWFSHPVQVLLYNIFAGRPTTETKELFDFSRMPCLSIETLAVARPTSSPALLSLLLHYIFVQRLTI